MLFLEYHHNKAMVLDVALRVSSTTVYISRNYSFCQLCFDITTMLTLQCVTRCSSTTKFITVANYLGVDNFPFVPASAEQEANQFKHSVSPSIHFI
jgi:hypothetical protein